MAWNSAIIWPPGIVGHVRTRSREIGPGIFQVVGGSERDPAELTVR